MSLSKKAGAAALLCASCGQSLEQAIAPDELHLSGSRGWADGELGRDSTVYDTAGDSWRASVGLTWSLAPPPPDHAPLLRRIAAGVERREEPQGPPVLIVPQTDAREVEPPPEPSQEGSEGDDALLHWGKAIGGLVTLAGLVWAAIRQGAGKPPADPEP